MIFSALYQRSLKRLALVVLMAVAFGGSGFAQTFNMVTREASEKKSAYEIKKHNGMFDTLIVRQEKWDDMVDNYSTWTNNLQFKSVHDFVKFYVDHSYKVKIHDPYTFRLTYKVYGYGNMADTNAFTTYTDTLTISYKPDSLATFQDMQFRKYSNFHKMMVVMTGLYEITGANNPPVPVNLDSNGTFNRLNFMVEATILVQPFHKKVKVGNTFKDVYGPASTALATTGTPSGDNLNIQWTLPGLSFSSPLELTPVNYELEWTYIDNFRVNSSTGVVDTLPASALTYNFKQNSTRVVLSDNRYSIPLIYQSGYLVYRVRMVRPDAQQYKYPIYGPWNLVESGTLNSVGADSKYAIKQSHLRDSINWQYTVSFAEQGKYKQVMSYYDGMLKNRQSITRFNSMPQKLIATEQVYDFEGRPSITILPTPVSTQAFRYQYNLSLNSATSKPYRAQDFDYISLTCPTDKMPSPLAIGSPAYIYYSPQNPDQQGFQKFVPDAGGYPFVQTIYSAGYDERVEKQGGAGDSLQIGTGHTVKNSYVSAEQMDLNRMFGLDIGWASFYRKTVSRDPNGQLSLNVSDYKGKTVTSAMIGVPDTISQALVMNNNVPGATAYTEDFIQGLPQQTIGNKRILDKLFFNDAAGNVTAQYQVTMKPFPTFCAGKFLNVAMNYDYKIFDECGTVVANQNGLLGSTGVSNSASPFAYTSPLNSFFMQQGKHSLHKELTVNTDDVGKAVDQFMALTPAENCLRSEQSFIKETVLSKTFPCPENYENLDCNSCAGKKYEMMQELWPNKDSVYAKRKYGVYSKNTGTVVGNTNSIFTLFECPKSGGGSASFNYDQEWRKEMTIAKGGPSAPPPPPPPGVLLCPYYRYQDTCLVTLPASITKNGRTYTNLRTLPVDTFIYIFNDTIAEALLPLHPEYCSLLNCVDDLYEKRLRKIPDYKVAEALGLLKLSDIIAADPLFAAMQANPAAYPNAYDTLAYTMGGRLSLDTLAMLQAYCNCNDTLMMRVCYENMFGSQIAGGIFASNYVKERYSTIIISQYIANRKRYLFNLNPAANNAANCDACKKKRMKLVPQPVFMTSYNTNGTLAVGSGTLYNTLQLTNPAAGSQLQQYNAFLFNADSLNAAQDSAINAYNSANTLLCTGSVDAIIAALVNCADSIPLASVRTKLLNLCNTGQVLNGAYSPDQIRTALTSSGITLDDLCNPYLINYDNNMSATSSMGSGKFLCNSDKFYTDATTSLNGAPLQVLKTPANVYAKSFIAGNDFDSLLKIALGNPSTCAVSLVHPAGSPLYTIVFSSGANTVKLYLRTPSQGSCSSALAVDPTKTLSLTVDCINNVPFSNFANGYIGKYHFAVTAKRTAGSVTTQCVLPAWTDKVEMSYEGTNQLAGCIPPTQMRNMFSGMMDTFARYQVRAFDHPYFKTMTRNYLNLYLKKAFTTDQYMTYIENCGVGMYKKIFRGKAYGNIVLNTTADADVFMTAINNVVPNVPVIPMHRQRSGIPERVLIDFNTLPVNKLRVYRDFMKNYTAGLYTTVALNGVFPSSNDSIMGIWYVPNSANFVPPVDIVPSYYPYAFTSSYYANSNVQVGSDQGFSGYKTYYIIAPPGSTDVTRALYTLYLENWQIINNWPGFFLLTREPTAADFLSSQRQYMNYAYTMLSLPPNKVLDSLLPPKLESSSFFSGVKTSYGHPAQPGNIQNLYFADPNFATDGTRYDKLAEILTTVKNYFNQNTGTPGLFFTGSNTRQIQPNNRLTAFRCRDSAFWFRHFDSGDTLYNVFIRIPSYIDTTYLPGYRLDDFTFNFGEENSFSFKVKLTHNNPSVPFPKLELDGYTDFVVAKNEVVRDVLLAHPINEPIPVGDTVNNCERQLLTAAILEGKIRYKMYMDSVRERLYADFYKHVMDTGTKENLFVKYRNQRFNYTLYYYDRAGNLMRTVPPAGMNPMADYMLPAVNTGRESASNSTSLIPYHTKPSNYNYNTLDQVVKQKTPDGGTTEYFYDAAGRAIFSQNEKQRQTGYMTYTLYDKQGRIIETGESKIACTPYFDPVGEQTGFPCSYFDNTTGISYPYPAVVYNLKAIPHTDVVSYIRSLTRSEVVLTNYDTAALNITTTPGFSAQENLRKRVSSILYFDKLAPLDTIFTTYNYGMHFSYDIAGNVKTLVRDYPSWKAIGHQFKRIDYDYDLISGKVNLLSYNRSFADQFFQRYSYDADNRITEVETSQDGYIWKRDAGYEYYQHGPLARMSLGDLRVQGVDYAYTIQGWLKAVNGDMLDTVKDMGGDGRAVGNNIHARDAAALSLSYFKGDYKPIGNVPVTYAATTAKNMYNGNIPRATTAIAPFPDLGTAYTYDQLNRLVKADYAGLNRNTAQLTNTADYYSSYAYDPDGNLQKLVRNGNKPATRMMDSLIYRYAGSGLYDNKLQNVNDYAANNYQNDIAQHTNEYISRYLYDPTGNVIKDQVSGQDTIQWNHYNKVTETRNDAAGNGLVFAYDGAGNRYMKTLASSSGDTTLEKSDYYVRDAQGNILAVYKDESRYVMTKQQWIEYVTLQFVTQCGIDKYVGNLITPYFSQNGVFKDKIMEEVSGNESWVNTQLATKPVSFYLNTSSSIYLNFLVNMPDHQAWFKDLAAYNVGGNQNILTAAVKTNVAQMGGGGLFLQGILGRNLLARMDVMGLLCVSSDVLQQAMTNFNLTPGVGCLSNIDVVNNTLGPVQHGLANFMSQVNAIGLDGSHSSYKDFLVMLFKPTTIIGKENGTLTTAYELMCKTAPNLLKYTMTANGMPDAAECPQRVQTLIQQFNNQPDALFNFMKKIKDNGLLDQYVGEYQNFMQELAVDNKISQIGAADSTFDWVLNKICEYMPNAVEYYSGQWDIPYTPGECGINIERLKQQFSQNPTNVLNFAGSVSYYAAQNKYEQEFNSFMDEVVSAPRILNDPNYTSRQGTLTSYYLTALLLSADPNQLLTFFDTWNKGRAILEATSSKPALLAANYDGDATSFLTNYVTYIGNADVINKGLYSIADLNLHSFVDKIKQSNVTSVWCTVTTVDSIIHNTLLKALQYERLSLSSHHLYGSSRLGTRDYPSGQYYVLWDNTGAQPMVDSINLNSRRPWYSMEYDDNITGLALTPYGMTDTSRYYVQHQIGKKQYELTNHLGNVQATLTDYRTISPLASDSAKLYNPVIAAAYDYYPFGMLMPDRFVSDTMPQCITVTQSKWTTKKVLECYDIYKWVWPGYFTIGGGKATKIQETNPSNNGILVEASGLNSGVQFEFAVAADAINDFQLETSDLEGNGLVSFFEEVNGQQINLGSLTLKQPSQILNISIKPSTTKIYTLFTGGQLGVKVKVKTLCKWVPVMVQENILVDICDHEKDRYRFGFNGQEKVNEWAGIGNHNTAEFWEYDTRTGRRGNLDPVRKYWESGYSVLSGSPIWKVDPGGNTDFYTQKGKLIGRDGKWGNGEIVVVTDNKIIKKIEDEKATVYDIDPKYQFLLPPSQDRQEIKQIMSTVPANADYEVGGRGLRRRDGNAIVHIRAVDGDHNDFSTGQKYTTTDVGSTHKDYTGKMKDFSNDLKFWFYSWHSHPSYKKSDAEKAKDLSVSSTATIDYKEKQTQSSLQEPSDKDIKGANTFNNFVVSPEDKKVYFYNADTKIKGNHGNSGSVDIDVFYDIKEGGQIQIGENAKQFSKPVQTQ